MKRLKPPSFSWFILTFNISAQKQNKDPQSCRTAGCMHASSRRTRPGSRSGSRSRSRSDPCYGTLDQNRTRWDRAVRQGRRSGSFIKLQFRVASWFSWTVQMHQNDPSGSKWSLKHLIWPKDKSDHAHAAAPHLWPWVAMSMARRTGTGDPPSVTVRTSMDFLSGRRLPWRLNMGESTRFLGGSAETGRQDQQFRTQRLKVSHYTSLSRWTGL